jgi:hypothetical protein
MPSRRAFDLKFSALGIAATFVAWVLSAAALVCWALAATGLLLACGAIFASKRIHLQRRFPYGALVVVAILVAFALPIWGAHQGGRPLDDSHGWGTHSHPIWQLGHLH